MDVSHAESWEEASKHRPERHRRPFRLVGTSMTTTRQLTLELLKVIVRDRLRALSSSKT